MAHVVVAVLDEPLDSAKRGIRADRSDGIDVAQRSGAVRATAGTPSGRRARACRRRRRRPTRASFAVTPSDKTRARSRAGSFHNWRRKWDSNPGKAANPYTLSRRATSTAHPSHRTRDRGTGISNTLPSPHGLRVAGELACGVGGLRLAGSRTPSSKFLRHHPRRASTQTHFEGMAIYAVALIGFIRIVEHMSDRVTGL
jgi:hypothetical protein